MKRISTLLKILTLFSYCLPFSYFFIGCENLSFTEATFSKKEANKILARIKSEESVTAVDSITADTTTINADTSYQDSVLLHTKTVITEQPSFGAAITNDAKIFFGSVMMLSLFPTEESISAIGLLFWHMNYFISTLLILSMMATLTSLFVRFSDFIKKHIRYVFLINIVSLLLLICYATYSGIMDWQWGILATLGLLCIQLAMEVRSVKNIS